MLRARFGLFAATLACVLWINLSARAATRTEPPRQPGPIQWGQVRLTTTGSCEASIPGSRDWTASGSCVIEFATGVETSSSAFLFSSPETLTGLTHVQVDRMGRTVRLTIQGREPQVLDFTLIHG